MPIMLLAASVASLLVDVQSAAAIDSFAEYSQQEQRFVKAWPRGNFRELEAILKPMLEYAERTNYRRLFYDHSRAGNCAFGLGRYREAVAFFTRSQAGASQFRPQSELDRNIQMASIADNYMGLASCYSILGEHEKALEHFDLAIVANAKFQHLPTQEAKAMMLKGVTYKRMGKREKAEEMYRQTKEYLEPYVAREARPGRAAVMMSANLSNWATLHREIGRHDLAEPMFRQALKLQIAVTGWDHQDVAVIASNLGNSLSQQDRELEARELLEFAHRVQKSHLGDEHDATLLTLAKLAHLDFVANDYAAAEAKYRQVNTGLENRLGPEHSDLTPSLSALGKTLFALGNKDEAQQVNERALKIAHKHHGKYSLPAATALYSMISGGESLDPQYTKKIADQIFEIHDQIALPSWMAANARTLRAVHLWESGDKQQALANLQQAIDLLEASRWHVGGAARERAESFVSTLPKYELLVNWQTQLGDPAAVFAAMEAMKSRTFLDELELRGLNSTEGAEQHAESPAADRRTAELRQAVNDAENALAELPAPGPTDSAAEQDSRRAAVRKLLAARDELYRFVAEQRRSTAAYQKLMSQNRQFASLKTVQESLLAEDELMLVFEIGFHRSFVFAIRRDSAQIHPLQVSETAAESLGVPSGPLTDEKMSILLTRKKGNVMAALSSAKSPLTAATRGELAALWQCLIPVSEQAALTSGEIKHLTIIPTGALGLLPFETLIVTHAEDVQPQFLLDVGPPIRYAPSASVLLNLAQRAPSPERPQEPVLAVGDPAYLPNTLARLPHSGLEATWVKQLFDGVAMPTLLLTGAQATEGQVRRTISGREILHLACHGRADPSYASYFSALALAPGKQGDARDDGLLTMAEISQLDLTGCELAILSACETNYGPQQTGEGVWALSRSFLIAGSRRVVASNWVVDDRAGATLVSYYASLLTKAGKETSARDYAAALHQAKKLVRKDDKWKHPFYWSSLVMVGPK